MALAMIFVGLLVVGVAGPMTQTAVAATGINQQVNFQGRLLTNSGAVVPDGNYNIRFKIYQDGDGVFGGGDESLKWTEIWQNNIGTGSTGPVILKNGYFSVSLGKYCALSGGSCQGNTNTGVNWNQDTLWLSMDVTTNGTDTSTTPTYNGEMSPFRRIGATAQAFNSSQLEGLTSAQFVQLAQGVQTASTSTNPAIGINATSGSGNLITLQSSGTDVFDVTSTGNVSLGGNADKTINVLGPSTNIAGRALLVQAGTGGTGATGVAGGRLTLQGGNAAGTSGNANGGDVLIYGGTKVNAGTDGNVALAYNGSAAVGTVGIGKAANASFMLDINGTINTSGTMTFTGVTTDITTVSNQDLTLAPNGTGKLVVGGTTPTVNSAGALTVSTSANGNLNLSPNGTGDVVISQGAGSNLQVTASAASTVDQLAVSNSGFASTTTGVDGIAVTFGSSNASGDALHVTPSFAGGATDLLTYNALEVDAFSPTNAAGTDTVNGIKLGNLTDPGATITSTALNIGSGWDTVLKVNGTTVVDGSGIVQAAAGGTGQSTYTVGDLLYAATTSTLGKLAAGAGGSCLVSGGVGAAPSWGSCGSTPTLQGAYTGSAGAGPSIAVNSTATGKALTVQNSATNSIAAGNELFGIRATGASDSVLGSSLFTVSSSGQVGINIGGTGQNPSVSSVLQVNQAGLTPGTVTNALNGTAVTGSSTTFLSTFQPGDTFTITSSGLSCTITSITSDTALTCASALGTASTNSAYTFTQQTRLAVDNNGRTTLGGALYVTNPASGRLYTQKVNPATNNFEISSNTAGYPYYHAGLVDGAGDEINTSKYNSGTGGTVSKLCVYFTTVNASNGYKVAIYNDGGTSPGSILSSGSSPVTTASSNSWNCASLGGTYTLAPNTNYWFAVTTQSGSTLHGAIHSGGTSAYAALAWGNSMGSPVTWITVGGNDRNSLYVPYDSVTDQSLAGAAISINHNNEVTVKSLINSSNALSVMNASGTQLINMSTASNEGLSLSSGVELVVGGAAFDGANFSMDVFNGTSRSARISSANSNTVPNLVLQAGASPGGGADLLELQNSSGQELASFSSGGVLNLGRASGVTGALNFLNSGNANAFTIQAGTSSAAQTWTLPTTVASSNQCLTAGTVAGSTVPLTWAACGSGGSGVTTVGTFSASPQTNGATISGSTITFGPADGTNVGMLTAGAQTIGGNKTFTGLELFQPASSLTNGQIGITQTLTMANATASGVVRGDQRNITVSSTTAATNKGLEINVTDNSTTTAHTDKGLEVVMSGTNTSQVQFGVDATVSRGAGVRGTSSNGSGSSTIGTATTGVGVIGSNTATGAASNTYYGLQGVTAVTGLAAYNAVGVFGSASGGSGSAIYGGYFTLASGLTSLSANSTVLQVVNVKPTLTGASGNNAASSLVVTGGQGGDTSSTAGSTAGTGAGVNIAAGAGGNTTGGSGTAVGGAGGTITLTAGSGNTALGAATHTPSAGGNVVIQGGTGGVGTSTSTNGNGGNVLLQGGAAGSGGSTGIPTAGGVLVKNLGDSATAFRVQNAAGTVNVLTVDTSASEVALGTNNSTTGVLTFNNAGTANQFRIQGGGSGSVAQTWTLPTSAPTAGQCLTASAYSAPTATLGWASCGGGGGGTLQNAYDASSSPATITTSSGAKGINIAAGAVPTVDVLSVSNAGQPVTTAGVNALSVNFVGGNAAVESAGMRVDFTPGGTSGGTWSGLRIVANATGPASGVTAYGIKLEGPTSAGAGTETGMYIGTGWDIGMDVQSGGIQLAAQTDPAAPAAGNLRIYAKDIAGRVMPKWIGPAGVDTPMQAGLGFNRVSMMMPAGGTTLTTFVAGFGTTFTNTGTANNPTPTSTNLLNSVRRATFSTGTTAGTVASHRQSVLQVWRGNAAGLGGFFYTIRFGTSTLASGNRAFVGMADSTAAPTNVDPTTTTAPGKIGMAINANTGNWKVVNNVTGTAPTVVDLGANFTVNTTSLYELIIYSPPNGSAINYRVTNLSTGSQTSGSWSSNIPSNTTFLAPLFWITNNATAGAAILDFSGWYLESDN